MGEEGKEGRGGGGGDSTVGKTCGRSSNGFRTEFSSSELSLLLLSRRRLRGDDPGSAPFSPSEVTHTPLLTPFPLNTELQFNLFFTACTLILTVLLNTDLQQHQLPP